MSENMTISRPYAKAIFHIASKRNLLNEWDKILSSLAAIINNDLLSNFLGNRTIAQNIKSELVVDLLKSTNCYNNNLDKEVNNFIKILSLHGRLLYVKDIYFLYKIYMNNKLGRAEAVIRVAYPLSNTQKEHIVEYLSTRFNKQILASFIVDNGLLGGFLAKIGDFVLDASVYGNLVSLRAKIIA